MVISMEFLSLGDMKKKSSQQGEILGSCLNGTFCIYILNTKTGLFFINSLKPTQTSSFFWVVVLDTFFRKKYMAEAINLQNTRVKQQFTWTKNCWIIQLLGLQISRLQSS